MTLIGQGLGQMSFAVCVWVSEADGLSPMGTVQYRVITESRAVYLKRGKVARLARPAGSSTAREQTPLEESGNR